MLPKNFQFSSRCQQVSTRRGDRFSNQLRNITENPNNSVHPIAIQKTQTVYWSGLTIVIGSIWDNSLIGRLGKAS